jgi:hypothetical protein
VEVPHRLGDGRGILRGDEQAGHRVLDELGHATDRGGDDRPARRHRLEVDDPERLVP